MNTDGTVKITIKCGSCEKIVEVTDITHQSEKIEIIETVLAVDGAPSFNGAMHEIQNGKLDKILHNRYGLKVRGT